jgi:hypothetical protein
MASLIPDAPVPIQPTLYALPPVKHVPPVQNDCFIRGVCANKGVNSYKSWSNAAEDRVEISISTSKASA